MNRNLLVFSVLLILFGISFGFYFLSVLGFFLLFPSILTTPRPRQSRVPTSQTQEQPRRIAPRPAPPRETVQAAQQAPPVVVPAATQPSPVPVARYSPALFPTSMFPSFSVAAPSARPAQEPKKEDSTSKDELLEVGALMALLKLFFG